MNFWASKYCNNRFKFTELVNEGYIRIQKQNLKYPYIAARNAICTYIRQELAQDKRGGVSDAPEMLTKYQEGDYSNNDHEADAVVKLLKFKTAAGKMIDQETLNRIMSYLSEDEKKLLHQRLYLKLSQREIGEMYGVTRQTISFKIIEIYKKIKRKEGFWIA